MRVLLINPPSPFLINPMAFPPLSLLYLAAAMEAEGHSPIVHDMNMNPSLGGYSPDAIGLTGMTSHVMGLQAAMAALQKLYPGVPRIIGGPHFSHRPNDAFKMGADAVCIGDGEGVLLDFIYGTKGTLSGHIHVDDYPMPARHLINLHAYPYHINGLPATSIMTSRGCPYTCSYCTKEPSGAVVRYRHIDKVAQEVNSIRKMGFGAVNFYDDEVNLSTRRLSDLCDVMLSSGLKWRGFVRSNLFTLEQATMMRASGCVEVCCGCESGSDRILQNVNKRATVADSTEARRVAAEAGLRFKAFMMIGLPGETEESVAETRKWLLTAKPDDFDLCPFAPYPGSDVADFPNDYDIKVEKDYWTEPYFHKGIPGKYHVVVSTSALSSGRIGELRDKIEQEVRQKLGLPILEVK